MEEETKNKEKIQMNKSSKNLLTKALEKYSKREVSLGRAAELAKIPISDFMEIAAKRKIPINYTEENLRQDFKAVKKE